MSEELFEPRNIIVTGGCGFIGSNFVHYVVEQPPGRPRHRPGQADLRRQPREHRGAALRPRGARRGRHLRRRAAGQASSRATTPSCTTPPRATTTTPSPTRSRSCAPTWRAPSACWRPSASTASATTTSPPTRSTATWRSTTPPSSPRRRRTTRARPYSSHQGVLRHARARLDPHLRPAHHDLQLLQQLRPLPARGEVHPQADHQHHRRRPPQALRPRRERPRLDPHRGPLLGRLGHPDQGPHGGDLPHRRQRREEQHHRPAHDPRGHGPRPRGLRLGRRPPRPRPPLRHRLHEAPARARLEAGAHRLRRGAQGRRSTGTWRTRPGGARPRRPPRPGTGPQGQ